MSSRQTREIDNYLTSPKYVAGLCRDADVVIRERFADNKRIFFFSFSDTQALLKWLRHGEGQDVSITSLSWEQLDGININFGRHKKLIDDSRSIHNRVVIIIATLPDMIRSVTTFAI